MPVIDNAEPCRLQRREAAHGKARTAGLAKQPIKLLRARKGTTALCDAD
jgi:hypothetical protein